MSGGEIAPALYARTDVSKYTTGLRTLRNNYVLKHGGAANRSGSNFVCEAKDSSKAIRLVPFEFNDEQTYVLEFGDQYIRIIRNGIQVFELTQSITGITQADPAVATYSGADSYANGDEIYIFDVEGMKEINGRNYKIANVDTGANTFELQDMAGVDIDSTSFTAYTSGGDASLVYEIASNYLEAELFELDFVQSGDVITIVHASHPPAELSRTSDSSWALADIEFNPSVSRPSSVLVTKGASGSNSYNFIVTAISAENGQESLPGLDNIARSVTNITQAEPAVLTYSGTDVWSNGDEFYMQAVIGMTQVNDKEYRIDNVDIGANTFEVRTLVGTDLDSTGFDAYSSGGAINKTFTRITSSAEGTPSNPHVVTWSEVEGAQEYNIYRSSGDDNYGLVGISTGASFNDIGVTADTTSSPPLYRNVFASEDNYPSTVTYIQQRLAFANTNNEPEKVFLSRTADFKNFTSRSPVQEDDAFNFSMAGREVNQVKHLLDLNTFVIMTSGGEIVARGNEAGIITPTNINTKQQTYNGSTNLNPITIGSNALYVQARGSIIRDLGFSFDIDGYQGNDLTIFSTHLFQGYTLVDWAYTQVPDSIVWAIRNDGTMVGLTYVQEQEVLAWHRHDFEDGLAESVTSIPENNIDSLYVVVNRTIDGRTTRYIERMSVRQINETTDVIDKKFMDSHLSYDGRNTTATTMTLSGGTSWDYLDNLTLTSSTSFFSAEDVGNEIQMNDPDGSIIKCDITVYTSPTAVTVKPNKDVPVSLQGVAITDWAKAVDSLNGLWHLEGREVSIFADRFVVANPNNDSYDTVTVTGGAISLAKAYSVIHVGLPYTSDIETLDIDTPQGESIVDKRQKLDRVTLYVENTRGGFVGISPPDETADFLEDLEEIKYRDDENYDEPIELVTGTVEVNVKPRWNSNGRIFIRQTDPIPMSILAIAPSGIFPFRG